MKKKKHKISKVLPGSIGEELELEPGDVLAEINHQPVEDVFDYRYLMNDEYIELLIEKANGEIWELEVEKDYDEDLGIEFENGLMDDYRSCSNHCMFCFIDQMPPGMRETLYFKDDDSRLSFLQGNYVTLTNMSQEDIQTGDQISPVSDQCFFPGNESEASLQDAPQPFRGRCPQESGPALRGGDHHERTDRSV